MQATTPDQADAPPSAAATDPEVGAAGRARRKIARPRIPAPLKGPVRWRRATLAVAAAVLIGLGVAVIGAALFQRASRIALADGAPPPFLALEQALSATPGPANEISIRAQLDRPRAYFIRDGAREVFIAPLYPEPQRRPGGAVRAVLFEPSGAVPEASFANWVRAAGPAGTVVELRGSRARPGARLRGRAARAFAAEGLVLAEDAVFVEPYLESRRRELAPGAAALVFGGLTMAAGALFGLFAALARPRV